MKTAIVNNATFYGTSQWSNGRVVSKYVSVFTISIREITQNCTSAKWFGREFSVGYQSLKLEPDADGCPAVQF